MQVPGKNTHSLRISALEAELSRSIRDTWQLHSPTWFLKCLSKITKAEVSPYKTFLRSVTKTAQSLCGICSGWVSAFGLILLRAQLSQISFPDLLLSTLGTAYSLKKNQSNLQNETAEDKHAKGKQTQKLGNWGRGGGYFVKLKLFPTLPIVYLFKPKLLSFLMLRY